MTFDNPQAASLLLLSAAPALLFFLGNMRRQRNLESFAAKELLPGLLKNSGRTSGWLKTLLVSLAVLFLVLTLMRPEGEAIAECQDATGIDLMIAVDTSRSMLARDVKPDRLELAKDFAGKLVKNLKGDRAGLIAFSGNAFLMCPLTSDYDALSRVLDSLDAKAIPRGGTSLAAAIREAKTGFAGARSKGGVLLLITDGEDNEGDPVAAAAAAKEAGITIFTVGVGTKAGELIAIPDENGAESFLKDRRGNIVTSRLNEAVLTAIADAAGGTCLRLTDAGTLPPADWFSGIARTKRAGMAKKHPREWFQIPLLLALLLLLGEALLPEGRKLKKGKGHETFSL
jgi:Ca-activated chloride channel family protein